MNYLLYEWLIMVDGGSVSRDEVVGSKHLRLPSMLLPPTTNDTGPVSWDGLGAFGAAIDRDMSSDCCQKWRETFISSDQRLCQYQRRILRIVLWLSLKNLLNVPCELHRGL